MERRCSLNLLGSAFKLGAGLAVCAGVVLSAPAVIPILAGIMHPLAKAAIKGGILAYEGFKITLAGARDTFEDLVAEARAEIHPEQPESSE
jgi:hypothetical protein